MLPRFSLYGGVEQFGYRLAELLARRGHAVDFICARQETDAPQGVRVLVVGRPPGFKLLKMLWFLVRAEQVRKAGGYDLVLSLGKTWQQDISRMGGGPLRVFWDKSERALPPGWRRFAKKLGRRLSPSNQLTLFLEKRQFSGESDVVAVSHLVRDWLLGAHDALDPGRVRVVYNRPDTSRFFPPAAEKRRAARNKLIAGLTGGALREPEAVFIGTASTNFQLKGVDPLIRSLALLPENTGLFVAGGRESAAYAALARRLGLEHRVRFCGRVDDMPSFYQALDIFILPTFYDACSNAVLEALASGCKVLTSRDNGAAFFLEDAAVLPDPGDVEDMAARLRRTMESPAPPPFLWPRDVPNGLEDFADLLERKLAACAVHSKRAERCSPNTL
jgi:UDP-glucose:(heptosyl)LPS alpha-1,3-glucosyltransferase